MALKANLDIAQRLDITCRKGDSFELVVIIKDVDGVGLDLTSFTDFNLDVRPTDEDTGTPILEFTNSDCTGTESGILTIEKPYADMDSVESGTFVYDLQATDGNGVRTTWLYGLFTIIDDVTI